MSKDVTVRFRCSHKESEQLKNVATNEGLSISAYILSKLFVPQNKKAPIKAPKPKKSIKPTKQPKQPVKTAKNSIYSTVRRPNAKNSPDRVVLKF